MLFYCALAVSATIRVILIKISNRSGIAVLWGGGGVGGLVKKEMQYIAVAIPAVNALFCLIIIVKAVHMCVSDSPLVKKEEQYIVLAIAAANALFCLIIIVKAVHICVGLVSFVSVAMMLIGMCQ